MNILKREDAQTIANILNGKQTLLVMKKASKNGEGRWWYLYCSKNGKDLLIEKYSKTALFVNHLHDIYEEKDILNGKVVARFWCDKVEEIKTFERHSPELLKQSCLNANEFYDYLIKGKNFLGEVLGYAIHISDLEIFDRPRELSEFKKIGYLDKIKPIKVNPNLKDAYKSFEPIYNRQIEREYTLDKAPTNYCYIEGE